jgi:NAD(P)H dehydrogenase (quinone)
MRIAVTGASGRIGGEVVRLLAAQQHQVVALTRRPPSARPGPAGAEARQADYADERALAAALSEIGTLVLVSSDGPVADVIVHHRNLIRAAARRGVAHIVALSGLDAALDSPFCYAVGYGYTEQLLAESGCAFSLARASIYTEFFLSFLTRARTSGQLRLPAADGRVSFVSRGDVARSLAALATGRPAGRPRAGDHRPRVPGHGRPRRPGPAGVGHPGRVHRDHPGGARRGPGRRRRGPVVDLRLHLDVRLDPRPALGRSLCRHRATDRPPAHPGPHDPHPLPSRLTVRARTSMHIPERRLPAGP